MTNKKNTIDKEFQMDQLRKDKLILSTESISIFVAAFGTDQLFKILDLNLGWLIALGYLLALIFFIRMLWKNIRRKQHIRELERQVYGTEMKYLNK